MISVTEHSKHTQCHVFRAHLGPRSQYSELLIKFPPALNPSTQVLSQDLLTYQRSLYSFVCLCSWSGFGAHPPCGSCELSEAPGSLVPRREGLSSCRLLFLQVIIGRGQVVRS